jgi:hypothetical protein
VRYTMYFDDATIQDWGSLRASGQRAVRQLMEMLGTPFAAAKQQDMDTKDTSTRSTVTACTAGAAE